MIKHTASLLTICFILILSNSYANTIKQDTLKPINQQTIFGSIYTGFYYGLNDKSTPKAGFGMSSALLGYSRNINNKVKATLIYDVYKTTSLNIKDTSSADGYFEGSKYTAFLKMAQIDWKLNDKVEFSVGQLLNEQYLTFNDKFWGFRYIDVTFQEKYKYGAPADFGARLKFNIMDNLKYSVTLFNGEGPFRHQDDNGTFLISNNIEFTPIKGLTAKLYVDYQEPSDTSSSLKQKTTISGFLGYKTDIFRLGLEYNQVDNPKSIPNNKYSGASIFGAYKFMDKFEALARYDYIKEAKGIEKGHYIIAGLQYEPVKRFMSSINYRLYLPDNKPYIYINFGMKF